MQIVTLEPYQFDTFTSNHKYRNYYQTSSYGKTMAENGYNIHYLGIKDNAKNLIGASLIIYKEVFMGQKIAYAPRGILFDYTDLEKVKELSKKLKQVLGKQGFIILKILKKQALIIKVKINILKTNFQDMKLSKF